MKAFKLKVLVFSVFFLLCQISYLFSQANVFIVDETGRKFEFEIEYFRVTAGLKILNHQKTITQMRLEGKNEAEIDAFLFPRHSLSKSNGSGIISGKVFYGDDHLVNVTIALYTEYGEFVAQTVTNYYLNGEYEIQNLSDGGYYVLLVPEDGSGFVREFYNDVIYWQESTLVMVVNSAHVSGINFDLDIGASISGTVYGEDGITPLANTVVDFKFYDAEYRWFGVMQTTQSDYLTGNIFHILKYQLDNSGNYKITGLRPDKYKIALTSMDRSFTFYDQAKNWLNADVVTIEEAEEEITNIDFMLERASTVNVYFVDSDSNPVPTKSLALHIYPVDSVGGYVFKKSIEFDPFTDNPYIAAKVSPGSYYLFGIASGYGWKFYNDAISLGDATPIKLASGETQPIYLTLGDWRPDRALGVKVYDQNGQLVRRLIHGWDLYKLHYGQYDYGSSMMYGPPLVPDKYTLIIWPGGNREDTSFTFSFGEYRLSLETEFWPQLIKRWNFPYAHKFLGDVHSFSQADIVELIAGDTVDVELHLSGGGVSGWIWPAAGNAPMEGAFVFIYNADTGEKIGMTETDENGLYGIENLNGNFKILVRAKENLPFLANTFYGNESDMDNATTVMVPDTGIVPNLNIVMQEAGTICGQVISKFNPSSLMNTAIVVAYDARSGKFMGWDDLGFNGRYCVGHLPEGNYKVCCYFRKELAKHVECTVAYYGGGSTFIDESSTEVSVLKNSNTIADIRVVEGMSQISGNIIDAVSGNPAVSGPYTPKEAPVELGRYDRMIMYDKTGHLAAMASLRLGSFDLRGMKHGDYFLRSDIGSWEYLDQWHDGNVIPLNQEDPFDYWINTTWEKRNKNFFWGRSSYFVTSNIHSNSSPLRLTSEPIQLELYLTKSTATKVEKQKKFTPTVYFLSQNHPNPFNPVTLIEYQLPQAAQVELAIYNLLGQKIKTLVEEKKPAGQFTVQWYGRNDQGRAMPSGVYLYRLQAGDFVDSKKMLLIR